MTNETQEHVYAVGHPHGYVKIGRSNDPKQRLSTYQTGSPYDLWLIVQIPVEDSHATESRLHEHLSEKQVSGEWFDLDYEDYDDLVDMVKMAASSRTFDSVEEFRDWQRKKNAAVVG